MYNLINQICEKSKADQTLGKGHVKPDRGSYATSFLIPSPNTASRAEVKRGAGLHLLVLGTCIQGGPIPHGDKRGWATFQTTESARVQKREGPFL